MTASPPAAEADGPGHPTAITERGPYQEHGPVAREALIVHVLRQGEAAPRTRCEVCLHRPDSNCLESARSVARQQF
jgi:hypothetical protein